MSIVKLYIVKVDRDRQVKDKDKSDSELSDKTRFLFLKKYHNFNRPTMY